MRIRSSGAVLHRLAALAAAAGCAIAAPGASDAQEATLSLAAAPGDRLGDRVAFAGDRIAVLAPGSSAGSSGAIVIAELVDGGWRVVRRLALAGRGGASSSAPLAIFGDQLVVGEFRHPDPLFGAGRVRVFSLDDGEATTIARQTTRIATLFGASVDIRDDLLVVGAPGDHVQGLRAGAAYVFRRQGSEWRFEQRLTSPRPAFGAFLGKVAIVGDRILVGSRNEQRGPGRKGAVHVFRRAGGDRWEHVQAVRPTGTDEMVLGLGMAVHGDWLGLGGRQETAGLVDLFRWVGGRYVFQQRIVAPGVSAASEFGTAMAMAEDVVVVGAPRDTRTARASGGVYVFARPESGRSPFELAAFLGSPGAREGDRFGNSLAIRGHTLLVGAPGTGGDVGAIHVYDLPGLIESPPEVFEPLAPGVLPPEAATALAQDRSGLLWIGQHDGAVAYDGARAHTYRHDPEDPSSMPAGVVLGILETGDGALWLGTEHGIARFDEATAGFHDFPVQADGYPRTSFVALFEDRDGALWTGTNGRLYRFASAAADRFEEVRIADDLPRELDEPYIAAIQQDRSGRLWVLAKNLWENRASLYRLDLETDEALRFVLSAEWGQLGPMHIDAADRMWLRAPAPIPLPSTPGAEVRPPGETQPDIHWGFHRDGDSRLWIAHDGGFHSADLSEPASRATPGTLAARAPRAFFETRDGSLLVATNDGVYRRVRAPARVANEPPRVAPVVLRRVEIVNRDGARTLSADGLTTLRLESEDARFTLDLGLPAFTDPDRVAYRYRIHDYDLDWIEARSPATASYTRLPPGSYVFEAEATVADPSMNVVAEPVKLRIEVAAPLHQRPAIRLLAAMAVGAIVLAVAQVRRRQRQHVQRLRRQIASDLHDDLSTNLSGVAMSGRMVMRDERLPTAHRRALDRIVGAAESMGADLRDIVWLVDPGRDTPEDVVAKMRRVADDLLGDLSCTLEIDGSALAGIDMADRRQLLLMYKECLHNAVRHADASRVSVRVAQRGSCLEMHVEDDGAGFEPDATTEGHGLAGLRARAERLGARLDIATRPGRGTRISVRFDR